MVTTRDVLQTKTSNWQADFQRDILGLEVLRNLTGGVEVNTQRDSLGRVVKHEVRSGANRTRSKSYQWQPNNRLKSIVDNIKEQTKEFNYDSFGNLVSCKTNETFDYFFRDEVGNIFKDKPLKGRKYEKGGRIEESETHEFFYDDEGNLTSKRTKDWKQHWHYEWNGDGSLKAVKRPDGELVSFKYDALGRRTKKKYKDTITNFVWDGNTPLHEWNNEAITEDKDWFGGKTAVDKGLTTWVFDADSFVPSAKLVGDKSYSIISDYLGTPCQAYSETGAKAWEYEQKSYGGVESLTGAINFIPFRYQGQYEDVETGLYYNRFRYYSPEEGSYISQDPIRLTGGFRLYGFVKDSNLWIDFWGLSSTTLNRNLGGVARDNKQAQHLIPEEVWNDTNNTQFFNDIGIGNQRDAASNGLLMWDNEAMATANGKAFYHNGSHPDYSLRVGLEVRDIKMRYAVHGNASIARQEISNLQNTLRTELDAGLSPGNTATRVH